MDWKLDYIRMWQQYYNKAMSLSQVDDLINRSQYQCLYIRTYKLGRLLEALGKLKFPNNGYRIL